MNGRRKATNVPSSASAAHRRGPNLNLTDQTSFLHSIRSSVHFALFHGSPSPFSSRQPRSKASDSHLESKDHGQLIVGFELWPSSCAPLQSRSGRHRERRKVMGMSRTRARLKGLRHERLQALKKSPQVRHIVDGLSKKLSREAPSPSSPSYRNGGIYLAPDTLLFSTSYGAATTITTIIRTTANTIPSIVTTSALQRLPHHLLAANAVSDAAISIQHALSVDNTRARASLILIPASPLPSPCPPRQPIFDPAVTADQLSWGAYPAWRCNDRKKSRPGDNTEEVEIGRNEFQGAKPRMQSICTSVNQSTSCAANLDAKNLAPLLPPTPAGRLDGYLGNTMRYLIPSVTPVWL
ncbi:hypothetical protein CMUS01_08314 [Colletotrichum musicola]|uniref:Uncharacterized protein n=1 Tax=Colletotrichum musicola TaxID=2175873 RepID=A0A8H6NE04_9PEZI|nr:hypothetical protein CMUS01_08314 [Colletotrichum musicola]